MYCVVTDINLTSSTMPNNSCQQSLPHHDNYQCILFYQQQLLSHNSVIFDNEKHWDSAYLRQGTCYPDPWLDHNQNLIICSLAHCQPSLKIS